MSPPSADVELHLKQLPRELRAVFAAACAERLLPAYLQYCQKEYEDPILADRLALVWEVLLKESDTSDEELRQILEEDEEFVPEDEPGAEYAQDAASAILPSAGLRVELMHVYLYTWHKSPSTSRTRLRGV